jgi:hypothetical protein
VYHELGMHLPNHLQGFTEAVAREAAANGEHAGGKGVHLRALALCISVMGGGYSGRCN